MIVSHEIKKINNEEVLYLYLDLSTDFSSNKIKEKSKKIADVVKKYINDNKISFKGSIAFLVVGSAILGSVILYKPLENYEKNNDINQVSITLNNDVMEIEETDNLYSDATEREATDILYNDATVDIINKTEEGSNTDIKNELEEEIIENIIYVNVLRKNGQYINLELEEYVIGVVSAEMPAAFNEEALKAQAVLARTYALKALSKGQTLTDNNSTQNYKTNEELYNIWGNDYDYYFNKVKNAVEETKGLYLSYEGDYIEAVYHSTSNGYTESSEFVWNNYYPYLITVESPYDTINPSFEKEQFLTYEEISNKLQTEVDFNTEFEILSLTSSSRIEYIRVKDKTYKGVDFRNLLGLRSTDVNLIKDDKGITFKTKGYGHGVGMSQYGANGMAKNGYSFSEILYHYYPGTTLNQLWIR